MIILGNSGCVGTIVLNSGPVQGSSGAFFRGKYLAVEHALSTGRPTLILTTDADVEEQFFKLLWLIETQYRGMLLADRYAEAFSQFRVRPFPAKVMAEPAFPFEPKNAMLIERDAFMRDILPVNPTFVSIQCVTVGTYFSAMTFGAEREMNRLLQIKDATGGMNTNRLGGRNLHASVAPVPIGGQQDCAAVAYDRYEFIQPNGPRLPTLDVMQAVFREERHSAIVLTSRSPLVDAGGAWWRRFVTALGRKR